MISSNRLLILTSAPVLTSGGKYFIDQKFVEGMKLYVEYWRGPVSCIMRLESSARLSNEKEFDFDALPFDIELIDGLENISQDNLMNFDIVLSSGDNANLLHISKICHEIGVPCVYIIEYTDETRRQITAIENKNIIKLYKTYAWIWLQERRRRRAFTYASGLQANGIPAFLDYSRLYKNTIQYFDTRMKLKNYSNQKILITKNKDILTRDYVKLVYSGRFEKMKGVDHLVPLAVKLKEYGLNFRLDFFGSGSLEDNIIEQIAQHGLSDVVRIMGFVDFETILVPILREESDLFINCHRQSDPSGTYLEVLSCGLPIVGYFNKAFKGILDLADVGAGAPIDDINGLAKKIVHLSRHKNQIATLSENALDFAKMHDFESVFKSRIEHLSNTLTAR